MLPWRNWKHATNLKFVPYPIGCRFESDREHGSRVESPLKTFQHALIAEWNRRWTKDPRHPKGRSGFESRWGYSIRKNPSESTKTRLHSRTEQAVGSGPTASERTFRVRIPMGTSGSEDFSEPQAWRSVATGRRGRLKIVCESVAGSIPVSSTTTTETGFPRRLVEKQESTERRRSKCRQWT